MDTPTKFNIRQEIFPILLILVSFAFGVYFYQHFPDRVASHWNFKGEVDGYTGKFFGSLFIPLLLLGMYVLFLVLPKIDPKKERYAEFMGVYNLVKTLILGVMFVIFLATGYYNLGFKISIGSLVPMLIGAMFIVMGNYMGKIKNNWFLGIKTPWTLSSENVWNKTHRLGGWLFMLFGLGLVLVPFLPASYSPVILFGGVIILVLGTFVYSYWLYRKEKENQIQ